jgi:hypothetical protein
MAFLSIFYRGQTISVTYHPERVDGNFAMFFPYDSATVFYYDEDLHNIFEYDFELSNYDARGVTATDNDIRKLQYKTLAELHNQYAENKIKIYITQ